MLASFEAERRDSVEKSFLGSGSNISKLQGVGSIIGGGAMSASSINLNSLKGLSLRSPLTRGGGGGGMNSGMGLLVLLGSEGDAALNSLFSLLQNTETADVRAYDRLETLSEAWTQSSKSAIRGSNTNVNPEDDETKPAYAKALAVALGQIGSLMAEEARSAADAIAELLLPCESAKLSLRARSSEVMVSVNTAVQNVKGSNTNVRVAWAGVADQHKLSNRRRHADVSRVKRIVVAASNPPPSKEAAVSHVENIISLTSNFTTTTPDGDGGGGCKWLALRGYRAGIQTEHAACEIAASQLKTAHAQAAELKKAALQVEREVIVLAFQARMREITSVVKHIRRIRLEQLELIDASAASIKADEVAAQLTAGVPEEAPTTPGADEKAAGVNAGNSWNAADWSEGRVNNEALAIRKMLTPFVKDAILQRSRLSLSSLDLDGIGDKTNFVYSESSSSSSSNKKGSSGKRSQMLSGVYEKAIIKANELIEIWAKNADQLIETFPVVSNGTGNGGGAVMTSNLMLKRMIMGRGSLPSTATAPAEILAKLETCLISIGHMFYKECDKIVNGGGFKSSFIKPEHHAISSLLLSSQDALKAAKALKAAPVMEEVDISSISNNSMRNSNSRNNNNNNNNNNAIVGGSLKRSSSVWLLVQNRNGEQNENTGVVGDEVKLRSGALVLTKEGFLHVFAQGDDEVGGGMNDKKDNLTTTFGASISSPPPTTFLEQCLFNQSTRVSLPSRVGSGNDDSSSSSSSSSSSTISTIKTMSDNDEKERKEALEAALYVVHHQQKLEPLMSIFISSDPNGRRTAVNKVKPGVFRLHVTESDTSVSTSSSLSSHRRSHRLSSRGTAHTLSLPPSLLASMEMKNEPPSETSSSPLSSLSSLSSLRHSSLTDSAVSGVLVVVESDTAADDWIEDLLRIAIQKESKNKTGKIMEI
jgi:hypothetical protein